MAKKSRRARRKRRDSSTQATGTPPSVRQELTGAPTKGAETLSASEFAEEYAYVYSDLKRIAILAGGFLTVLVLLAFILR
jgi:hypothetical protein